MKQRNVTAYDKQSNDFAERNDSSIGQSNISHHKPVDYDIEVEQNSPDISIEDEEAVYVSIACVHNTDTTIIDFEGLI
jgi:DUF4097 and DUF4098 domain-containing protein YvlB